MSRSIASAALAVLLAASAAHAASFEGLGDLPGGDFHSEAQGVSSGCDHVTGVSESALGSEAFLWQPATGMEPLPGADALTRTRASDVSADGGVFVGSRTESGFTAGQRWRLGEPPSTWTWPPGLRWHDTNADGSVLVGEAGSVARHLAPGRFVSSLGDLPGGGTTSAAFGVAGDGLTVVGVGSSSNGSEAFRWTAEEGMRGLGDLPGGAFSSTAFAASGDGGAIVGRSISGAGNRAFRWTAAEGMRELGPLPPGSFNSVARDVSADGLRVVGIVQIEGVGSRAMLWQPGHGVRRIDELLAGAGLAAVALSALRRPLRSTVRGAG